MVTITFTEAPDPSLSQLHVFDHTGRSLEQGHVQSDPHTPLTLRVAVPTLPRGAYTVTWRTLSAVDGHVASGTFAFGVGVAPATSMATPAAMPAEQRSDPLGLASKWALYIGLSLLLGTAWVGGLTFKQVPTALQPTIVGAWAISALGTIVLAASQQASAGIEWSALANTSLALPLFLRLMTSVGAGVAVLMTLRASGHLQRALFLIVGIDAAAAMFIDVTASHAASSSRPAVMIAAQWSHFVGVGVWVGGLAALIIGTWGTPGEQKARAIRRFSAVAGVALAVVAGTGVIRAVDEVGDWSHLTTTNFGQFVLLKVGLLGVLAGLGAINRYRSVPIVLLTLRGLRRIGAAELVVAGLVLAASAALTSLAPHQAHTDTSAHMLSHMDTDGSDFATTTRVNLDVTPAIPGQNEFRAHVLDYDTKRAVDAQRVELKFSIQNRPEVGESTLELERSPDGSYQGVGNNISLQGMWLITVLVQRDTNAVEVPLSVATADSHVAIADVATTSQFLPTLQTPCRFELGFQALADLLGPSIGSCLENAHPANGSGDVTQRTTGGLLVWRKAENVTTFTDGYRTWVNGPFGLQQRFNSQRFLWEANPNDLQVIPYPLDER
jgi:putative copper export protein